MLAVREAGEFPGWAARRLAVLGGAQKFCALRVFPIEATRRRNVAVRYAVSEEESESAETATPVTADADLALAIETRRPHTSMVGAGCRLLVPLSVADEVRHVIHLDGAALHGAGAALLKALIPLLSSYYDLLVEAETDPLTRLPNRRVFYSEMSRKLIRRGAGERRRFLAMADIDHFKQINDRFGHLYGDEILIHFARLMRATFRAGDLLYRFGGEEFVIAYSVPRAEDGASPLERFRAAVERYVFPRVGRVTASVGFTAIDATSAPATTLIDRADMAVYYAKRNGRNRVCHYEALIASRAIEAPQPEAGDATLF